MKLDNKKALHEESIKLDNSIILQNNLNFVYQDFDNSGINRDVTDRYINKGLLIPNDNGWKMIYAFKWHFINS